MLNPMYISVFDGITDGSGVRPMMMNDRKLTKKGLQLFLYQIGPFMRAQPFCSGYKCDKLSSEFGNRAAQAAQTTSMKSSIDSTTGMTPIKRNLLLKFIKK